MQKFVLVAVSILAVLAIATFASPVQSASKISLRSFATGNNAAGAANLTLTVPPVVQQGDVMLAQIVVNNAASVVTPPAGWKIVVKTSSISSIEEVTYYKVASITEPLSYDWAFDSTQSATGGIVAYAGVDNVNPIDAASGRYNESTENVRVNQVNTTVPNDMLVVLVGVSGNTTVTPASKLTEYYDVNNFASANGKTAEVATMTRTNAGKTDVGDGKENGLKVSNLAQLVALRASTAPSPAPSPSPSSAPTPSPLPSPSPSASPSPTPTPTPSLSSIKNVFVIVMENNNWSDIFGNNAEAPYINSLLTRSDASYAKQYYNPPNIHPSEPNYVWMEAGDSNNLPGKTNFASDNDPSSSNYTTTSDHLVTYLRNKGISWKAYQENMSAGSCPIKSVYPYAAKHNPFVFFADVSGNPPSATNSYCASHMAPFSQLASDLTNNTVSQYAFITPNLCNDMHDSCAPFYDWILQGDSWLKNNLPTILNSQAYQNGGAVFITWDEGEGSDGPIGMIILSPFSKGGGYNNSIHYDHSSLVKTLEEIFGVSPLLRNAAAAADLSDLFK